MEVSKLELKEFILGTLLPYKNDPTLCAIDEKIGSCKYLTKDGKMCAVGKHLNNDSIHYKEIIVQFLTAGVTTLNNHFNLSNILKKEVLKYNLKTYQWELIQIIHDNYAVNGVSTHNSTVTELEVALEINLEELRLENE